MTDQANAIASYRYRLREAARIALEIGDKLLQLSQDASEPEAKLLAEMRQVEGALDNTAYFTRELERQS